MQINVSTLNWQATPSKKRMCLCYGSHDFSKKKFFFLLLLKVEGVSENLGFYSHFLLFFYIGMKIVKRHHSSVNFWQVHLSRDDNKT